MKISELAKKLLEIKRAHGNVEVYLVDGESGRYTHLTNVKPKYPIGSNGGWDRTKPVDGVIFDDYKKLDGDTELNSFFKR